MGLIKTGLKAAVAVKVGHMVHDRIQRRQHAEWAAGGHPAAHAVPPAPAPAAHGVPAAPPPVAHAVSAAPAPATAPPPVDDVLAQLTKLGELKAAGVLTEAEFQTQKARILGG